MNDKIFLILVLMIANVIGDTISDTSFSSLNYMVSYKEANLFKVKSKNESEKYIHELDGNIIYIECNPHHDYLAYRTDKDMRLAKPYCILDLSLRKKYSGIMKYDKEKFWGHDGKFTYLNESVSFIIINTTNLNTYFSKTDTSMAIRIHGHPLGAIFQEKWYKNNMLFYSSGCCELTYYGILDIHSKQNFFIGFEIADSKKEIIDTLTFRDFSKLKIADLKKRYIKCGYDIEKCRMENNKNNKRIYIKDDD